MNNKLVLIVDDSSENIQVLIEILKTKYKVSVAKDGKKALDMIYNGLLPDLILLDIIMPEIDGFEVAKLLKSNHQYKDIPIIFNTAASDLESIKKAFEIGAADYITKPFNAPELIARVNTHIELSSSKQELKDQLDENALLLEQYKYIVDESDIVSKTNLKGEITYVNKKFEQTCGYENDELLGKSHSLVRHPDMPKSAFKNLWKTIKSKKIWHGEVKNLHKDGSLYVVDSTVMPICDKYGDIVEYISVRHDITDMYNLKVEIEDTQKELIFTLGVIGETRSKETGNHVKRVAEYSYALAKLYGLDIDKCEMLKDASPMHDIGKVAIADSILNKSGKLTKDEFDIMKSHSKIGYDLLKYSERKLIKTAAIVAYEHHERWDGKGYPNQTSGENIHIYGRITALADVFDALGSKRCYKDAWKLDKILDLIKEESGQQFDPILTKLFLDNIDEFLKIRDNYVDC